MPRVPVHDDRFWAQLKHDSPAEWADAVAFDHAIATDRRGPTPTGTHCTRQFFLHRQRVLLDQVALRGPGAVTAEADAPGCGPWTCPHPDEPPASPATEAVSVSVREVA